MPPSATLTGMKRPLIAAAAAAALLAAAAQPAQAAARPSGPPTYAQEFNGTKADVLADGWRTGWFGDGVLTPPVNAANETVLHDESLFTVSGGYGRLSARPNTEGKALPGEAPEKNLGSMINTDPAQGGAQEFGWGYIEARLWLPKGETEGIWPAWWVNGQAWPDDMEVDILESDGTQAGNCWNAHHSMWGSYMNLNHTDHCAYVAGSTSGWHTYAADIRPDGITWYYDGKNVGRLSSSEVPDAQRYLLLNVSATGQLTQTRTMLVDYVRVWEHSGLS